MLKIDSRHGAVVKSSHLAWSSGDGSRRYSRCSAKNYDDWAVRGHDGHEFGESVELAAWNRLPREILRRRDPPQSTPVNARSTGISLIGLRL
jgi:hypothetical protein